MRVAIVGLGSAGTTLHLPALAGLPEAAVVGVTDADPARRETAARRFGVRAFDDFERLLADARPELVVVATPPESHGDLALRALAAGAHVLCEKPFVASLAEADRVLAAAAAAGRRVALNHEFRQMPIFRALREAAGRPDAGELRFAQVWQLMDLPPWAEPGWRGRMLQRTLYEAGVHLVDLLVALFGERPRAVQAWTSTCGAHPSATDAVALVTLEFSRGRLAQITQNRLCRGETQYFEVRADTENLSLRASFGGRARLLAGLYRSPRPALRFELGRSGVAWSERGHRRSALARNPADPGMRATRDVLARTIAAFRDGYAPPTSGEEGRDVLAVVAAAYRSAATGSRCALDPPTLAALHDLRLT